MTVSDVPVPFFLATRMLIRIRVWVGIFIASGCVTTVV